MKSVFFHHSLILLVLASLNVYCQSKAKPSALSITPFASGFSNPVDISNAGDDRLFVVEQAGFIRIVNASGDVNPVPFLDIDARVKSGGEQGLLGLAFHPNYAENGYFYVNYTGVGDSTHISRFSVNSGNPDLVDADSEMNLLTIFQPYQNHNGGELAFGPDGYLYIGLGDGGSGGDPGDRAQDPMELLGKMLRIDVDGGLPYSIPASNPYYGSSSARNEIWAMGLRNPWRFSFDRLTGDLWIGDVGQNAIEEIDFQTASSKGGENYGWRCYEGNNPFNDDGCLPQNNYVFPVHQYTHSATNSCSVTGGYVYRGTQYPSLNGMYFFTDYCSDNIWALVNESGTWVVTLMGQFQGNNFSTFGEDKNGRLYIAGLNSGVICYLSQSGTGFIDDIQNKKVNIYPNPFDDVITIETVSAQPDQAQLTIFDLAGEMVYSSELLATKEEYNLDFLSDGIYFINLMTDQSNWMVKLVKQ